jgi:hypothetical protein
MRSKVIIGIALLLFSTPVLAATNTSYVTAGCTYNGNGNSAGCAASGGAEGAYNSLANWDAGEARNLTTGGEIEEVILANTSSTADTTKVVIDSDWTTDSGDYIKITGNATSGIWDATKYHFIYDPAGTFTGGITVQAGNDVFITGLQVKVAPTTASKNNTYGIYSTAGATTEIRNTIVWGVPYDVSSAQRGIYSSVDATTTTVINTIIYGFEFSGNTNNVGISSYTGTGTTVTKAYNVTIVDCYRGFADDGLSTTTAKNVGVSGATAAFVNIDTTSNNSTSTPTFVGAPNYHLDSSDTTWKDGGTDVSGENGGYSDDIDGDSRSGTWDIGADEITAGVTRNRIWMVH